MQPGDRLVTALVGDYGVGETFRKWMLHVTIVAWFRGGPDTSKLVRLLSGSLQEVAPFSVEVGQEKYFGYKGKTLVNLIKLPSSFFAVHNRVLQTLDSTGAALLAGRGNWGEQFTPHVTVQSDDRFHEGDTFTCEKLYVVSQQGSFKKIDAEVGLGKAAA